MENSKYRHIHFQILGKAGVDSNFAIQFSITANDKDEAIKKCRDLIECTDYIFHTITECFTPHDDDEYVKAVKELSANLVSISEESAKINERIVASFNELKSLIQQKNV